MDLECDAECSKIQKVYTLLFTYNKYIYFNEYFEENMNICTIISIFISRRWLLLLPSEVAFPIVARLAAQRACEPHSCSKQ